MHHAITVAFSLTFHIFSEKKSNSELWAQAPSTKHDPYSILSFTPPPILTHELLISIIINICLFNFQLCHNVSA